MRINRTYSIEADLVKELSKETNASELINKLLSDYFSTIKKKPEEIIDEVKMKMEEQERIEKQRIDYETKGYPQWISNLKSYCDISDEDAIKFSKIFEEERLTTNWGTFENWCKLKGLKLKNGNT